MEEMDGTRWVCGGRTEHIIIRVEKFVSPQFPPPWFFSLPVFGIKRRAEK